MYAELHFERGRIRAVLPNPVGTVIRTETDTYTYPGCHVFPGFVDAHCHLLGIGLQQAMVSLHDAPSLEACLDILADRLRHHDGGWVQAAGWNQERWTDRRMPTAAALDRVSGDLPVIARRVDGHALWCNSAALRQAGITAGTPDPAGGRIERLADGQPSGLLVDTAMNLVEGHLPALSDADYTMAYTAAAQTCAAAGITEVHDMDVVPAWLDHLRPLAESGHLAVRVQSYLRGQHDEWLDAGLLPAGGELLRVCGIKLFADGALGSWGASLSEPYADRPGTTGLELLDRPALVQKMAAALDAGWWSIAVHAIGDRANRTVLDAYGDIRRHDGGADVVLRLEHAQHLHPDDVRRCADLGVIASVQPSHCRSDAAMAERRLGTGRLPWSYRWQSLLDAGVMLAGGSDAPIEPARPLDALAAFCQRIPQGSTQPWQPQERLSRADAIDAITTKAHAAADMDYRRGSIAAGYDADVVVVDRDLRSCDDADLASTTVMATFCGGRLRYHQQG